MTMRVIAAVTLTLGMAACAPQPASPPATATPETPGAPAAAAPPAGGGLAGNAEQQAKQAALEKDTPKLKVSEEVLRLSIPGQTIGEAVGVAKNANGHLFVFSRTGKTAQVKGSAASMLFEFDPNLRYVKEWGPNNYAAGFAHTVRVDKDQNVWMVDEGSNMVVKYRPDASVAMVLGRKEEPLDWLEKFAEEGDHLEGVPPARNGVFNRPTDVTWDNDGQHLRERRLQQLARDEVHEGRRLGQGDRRARRGARPVQHAPRHHVGCRRQHLRGRSRQPPDPGVRPRPEALRIIEGMGAPWTVCTTPGSTQYLMSGDGNGKIYKMSLDGKLVGWAQTGLGHGQSGCLVHELHCESETVLYKGDCSTWTVEKITIQ